MYLYVSASCVSCPGSVTPMHKCKNLIHLRLVIRASAPCSVALLTGGGMTRSYGGKLVIKCASLQQTAMKLYDVVEVDLSALQEFPWMIGHTTGPKKREIWSGLALNWL